VEDKVSFKLIFNFIPSLPATQRDNFEEKLLSGSLIY